MDSRIVIRALEKAGWVHVSTRGSHHKFRHAPTGRTTVVPHPVKDIKPGTLRAIERDTGIKLR
jgi:predicted RNA binding protein YcfA (HicA-like mRNA interferase family)